jgi:uncharacterized damage-inducible protein DinB
MTIERQWPPFVAAERPMLESWLEFHRVTLLNKCEGLTSEQLSRRSVPPSGLSLLGLVRHMAEVERNWFARVFAGLEAPSHYCTKEEEDADFDRAAPENADEGIETFKDDCDVSRKILAGADSLDARDPGGGITMRWIVVHMIEEYARHNGHADLLRECIDGTTGD